MIQKRNHQKINGFDSRPFPSASKRHNSTKETKETGETCGNVYEYCVYLRLIIGIRPKISNFTSPLEPSVGLVTW